jgi:hypothetical protein
MNHGMLVCICLAFPCQHAQEDFGQARDFYNQGLALKNDATQAAPFFKLSSEAFRKCAGHLPETPSFFREWAAAELLAANPAHALAVSNQGLRLYPCDSQLLKISNWLKQELKLDTGGVPASFKVLGSRNIIALLGVFNLTGWVAVFLARGRLRKLGLFLVCGCMLGAGAVTQTSDDMQNIAFKAIVAEKPLFLKVGNDSTYPDHSGPALKPGTAIKVLDHQEDWFLVSTMTGRFGWVMSRDILIDWGN